MKTEIRYSHTSTVVTNSKAAALREVRSEAMAVHGTRWNRQLHTADTSDGLFVYLTKAAKDADPTGEDAFALICQPDAE